MKRIVFLLACLGFAVPSVSAQVVDATVCDILSNPQSFDGKMVRVKGTVIAGFEEFVLKDTSCKQPVNAIWLAYPEGTKAKAGPLAFLQLQLAKNSTGTAAETNHVAVQLEKDKQFNQFDAALATPYKGSGMCLGCGRYAVNATLVGRIDGTKIVGLARDKAGKVVAVSGFGNRNEYSARMVLQSVADVVRQEIDYSKATALTKDEAAPSTAASDPVAAAHQAAQALGAVSSAGAQIEQAAAVFGKPGEDNGVSIGFGVANEVRKDDGAKGEGNSPDGLLYNCTFQMERLKGDALSKAITHIGAHIAELRVAKSNFKPFDSEHQAWETTILCAIATRQKTLTLPGGYVVWSASWAVADRNKMIGDGISSFLTNWAGLGE